MKTGEQEVLMDLELDTFPIVGDSVRLNDTDYIVKARAFNIVDNEVRESNNLDSNILGIVIEVEIQ
jgi:hypothetical protein